MNDRLSLYIEAQYLYRDNKRLDTRSCIRQLPSPQYPQGQSTIPTGSVHNTHMVSPQYPQGQSTIPTWSVHNTHRVGPCPSTQCIHITLI